ncbi:MAG: D-arabinono-1,4-lactone oxidase [Sphingomonadaceae bacterium]
MAIASLQPDPRAAPTGWRNWSGSVRSSARVERPASLEALAALVASARHVRAVGAGHSFMPLVDSEELIVDLSGLPGDIEPTADGKAARVPAGWSLRRLAAELSNLGLALANQGDVDPQSVAGALATGTHGTGETLGSLSTFARGFRLMGPDGALRWCDARSDPELFQAQRLSLGLLGIVTEVELAVVPAFCLEERIRRMPLDALRAEFDSLAAAHRHAEFFLFPYADSAIVKTLSVSEPCDPPASTTDLEESAFRRMLDLGARLPFLIPWLQRLAMRDTFASIRRGPSHLIYPSERAIGFEEMEYELPRGVGFQVLDEALGWIRRRRLPVSFPFEFRTVAGDDIWLSPMNRGPVAAISMHQYAPMPWQGVFAEVEPIFRAAGGRPHWGKRHGLTRADVDRLYPEAERFRAVRRAADPAGKFLNPHLAELFA